jgi:hypothetical protein
MSIALQIQALGMTGLEPCEAETYSYRCEYCRTVAATITQNPPLGQYLGPHFVHRSFTRYATYGITFEGIREVLRLLKIRAIVATSVEMLKEAFSSITDQGAIVTDSGFLSRSFDYTDTGEEIETIKGNNHAISVFVDKPNKMIFINDSEANSYQSAFIRTTYGLDMSIISTKVRRQAVGDYTCNAFAINDCITFQNTPDLLNQMHQLAPTKRLPAQMITLDSTETARARALEFQALLIDIVVNTSPSSP